jgi:hypothetical protein
MAMHRKPEIEIWRNSSPKSLHFQIFIFLSIFGKNFASEIEG